MILEEETFREFGYYPRDWKPQSHKKILAACDNCGKVRITSKSAYCSLCGSCARKDYSPSEETRQKMKEAAKGRIPWIKGKHHSEETKKKISEAKKGQIPWNKGRTGVYSEESKRKIRENMPDQSGERNPMFGRTGENAPMFGRHHTEEAKKKMSEAKKGNHHTENAKKKMSESRKGKHHTEEARRNMSEARKGNKNALGMHHSEETRKKISETTKKNWQDPNFVKKVFDGLNAKPNGIEKKVGTILQNYLPKQYAYNGDFSCGITIGGKIPDFVNVNGEKVVIEVFGPWHDEVFMRERFGDDISWKRTEFGTKAHYSQFGYKCIVFWQEDLEREDVEDFVLSVLRENKIL